MKEKKEKTKKPIFKRWWFWVIVVIVIIGIGGGGTSKNSDDKDTPSSTDRTIQSEPVDQLPAEVSPDDFVNDTISAIQGAVGVDEVITNVEFRDRDLCVYVDFSQADPSPLTLEDLALSRTSSITDDILELTQYESLWDTITIDFGDLGYIQNRKEDMENNGYGWYFPVENFQLKSKLKPASSEQEDPDTEAIPVVAAQSESPKPESPKPESSPKHEGGGGNADNFNTYDNASQQQTEDKWVLNTSTMKIHYPTCSSVKKIAPQNYATSNLSEDELINKEGYTTCGVCHK